MIFTAAYKVGGTVSSRLASCKLLDQFGANFQNQPDHIRRLMIARPGRRFVQNDYEGAESVATALLCGEGNYRELVRLKIKTHNFLCVKLFPELFADLATADEIAAFLPASFKAHPNYKLIIKRCKELKQQYDLAKRTVHGSSYGMGWKTFQETVLKGTEGKLVLSPAECKRLLYTFFELFPEIRHFQLNAEACVRDFLPIANLFGHDIVFVKRFTAAQARTGISWAPQSTVGVCMILAACQLQDYIEKEGRDWDILTITHDSGLADAPESEAVEASLKLAECMDVEFTSPVDGWKFRIGVERQVGANWGKYDETENPEGVKVQ